MNHVFNQFTNSPIDKTTLFIEWVPYPVDSFFNSGLPIVCLIHNIIKTKSDVEHRIIRTHTA